MSGREYAVDTGAGARERRAIGEIAGYRFRAQRLEITDASRVARHATYAVAGRAQATHGLAAEHSGCTHDQYKHGGPLREVARRIVWPAGGSCQGGRR